MQYLVKAMKSHSDAEPTVISCASALQHLLQHSAIRAAIARSGDVQVSATECALAFLGKYEGNVAITEAMFALLDALFGGFEGEHFKNTVVRIAARPTVTPVLVLLQQRLLMRCLERCLPLWCELLNATSPMF